MEIKTADWKREKHVPVIEVKETDRGMIIHVGVGKEIPHPNTFEHHIKWIEVFFVDEKGNAFPVGKAVFEGHGEKGYTEPEATFLFKKKEGERGKIVALAFCNIHGLWKGEKQV